MRSEIVLRAHTRTIGQCARANLFEQFVSVSLAGKFTDIFFSHSFATIFEILGINSIFSHQSSIHRRFIIMQEL